MSALGEIDRASLLERWLDALSMADVRRLLGERGQLLLDADEVALRRRLKRLLHPTALIVHLAHHDRDRWQLFAIACPARRYPGRLEALWQLAQLLGERLPEEEYRLPEHHLEDLLRRARGLIGRKVPRQGAARHKGRVGDSIERMLVGKKVGGRGSDHPAAEIKSVPVLGDQVIERVKLGVVSTRSNPLLKCDRILFVFVEERGDDHFVRGQHVAEFDRDRWETMWRNGHLVETAAGSSAHPARGLYLTPRWFRAEGLWPQ
jgi:hypothetical protein